MQMPARYLDLFILYYVKQQKHGGAAKYTCSFLFDVESWT